MAGKTHTHTIEINAKSDYSDIKGLSKELKGMLDLADKAKEGVANLDLKMKVDTKGSVKELKDFASQISSVAKDVKNIKSPKIKLFDTGSSKAVKELGSLGKNIGKLDKNIDGIKVGNLESLASTVGRLTDELNSAASAAGNLKTNINGIGGNLGGAVGQAGKLTKAYNDVANSADKAVRSEKSLGTNRSRNARGGGIGADTILAAGVGKSATDLTVANAATKETNKATLRGWGGNYDKVFKQIDKATDESTVTMNATVPAMNAFKSATGASADMLGNNADVFTALGTKVRALGYSEQEANNAMMDLSKGVHGAFAALDQYGISEDALKATGKWNGKEDDLQGFFDAVKETVGDTSIYEDTYNWQKSQLEKSFSRGGAELGKLELGPLKSFVEGYTGLDSWMLKSKDQGGAGLGFNVSTLLAGAAQAGAGLKVLNDSVQTVRDTFNNVKDAFSWVKDAGSKIKDILTGGEKDQKKEKKKKRDSPYDCEDPCGIGGSLKKGKGKGKGKGKSSGGSGECDDDCLETAEKVGKQKKKNGDQSDKNEKKRRRREKDKDRGKGKGKGRGKGKGKRKGGGLRGKLGGIGGKLGGLASIAGVFLGGALGDDDGLGIGDMLDLGGDIGDLMPDGIGGGKGKGKGKGKGRGRKGGGKGGIGGKLKGLGGKVKGGIGKALGKMGGGILGKATGKLGGLLGGTLGKGIGKGLLKGGARAVAKGAAKLAGRAAFSAVPVIGQIAGAAWLATDVLDMLGIDWFSPLAQGAGAVLDQMGPLGQGIKSVGKSLLGAEDWFFGGLEKVMSGEASLGEVISGGLTDIRANVKNAIAQVSPELADMYDRVSKIGQDKLMGAGDWLMGGFKKLMSGESLGSVILGGLKDVRGGIVDMISAVNPEWGKALQGAFDWIDGVAGKIGETLGPAISGIGDWLKGIDWGQVAQFLSPIGMIAEGIGSLFSGDSGAGDFLGSIGSTLMQVGQFLSPLAGTIGQVIQGIGPALGAIGPVIGQVAGAFAQAVTSASPLLDILGQIGGAVGDAFSWLITNGPGIWDGIVSGATTLKSIIEPIGDIIKQIITDLQGAAAFFGGIGEMLGLSSGQTASQNQTQPGQQQPQPGQPAQPGQPQQGGQQVGQQAQATVDSLGAQVSAINEQLNATMATFQASITTVVTTITTSITTIATTIATSITMITTSITTGITSILTAITMGITQIGVAATTTLAMISMGVTTAFASLGATITATMATAIASISAFSGQAIAIMGMTAAGMSAAFAGNLSGLSAAINAEMAAAYATLAAWGARMIALAASIGAAIAAAISAGLNQGSPGDVYRAVMNEFQWTHEGMINQQSPLRSTAYALGRVVSTGFSTGISENSMPNTSMPTSLGSNNASLPGAGNKGNGGNNSNNGNVTLNVTINGDVDSEAKLHKFVDMMNEAVRENIMAGRVTPTRR